MKAAILISGRGSNMEAILQRARDEGWLSAIALVLSNRADAAGLVRARAFSVPTDVVDHGAFADRAAFDEALGDRIEASGASWVVLAGFMRILGAAFVARFAGRILNIHPSLLPALPGLHTHRRALEAGLSAHGCTVHLVDASLDGGPMLAQATVPVLPGDDEGTLAARVLREEHRLYPAVVHAAVSGQLDRAFPARSQTAEVEA